MIYCYINWNPNPEIINILGISIRYYGLLFASGLILSVLVLRWLFAKENLSREDLEKLTIYGVIGILIGARLGHCLFYEPSYYLSHPLEMILPIRFISEGGIEFTGYQGLASHGGALGLLIALFIYYRRTGHSMLLILDLIAVVSGIATGFIRLGNLMNSEIIGRPTSLPWAFIFERVDNIPRHPAQLYEAISYFLIFALMLKIYRTYRGRVKNGFFFGLLLILIFIARFLIEFLKENQVDFEEGMSINMGQVLSIPYIIMGIGILTYTILKDKPYLK